MSSDRRAFLSGLASLPLIGGGVAHLGSPTAVPVPLEPLVFEPIAYISDLRAAGLTVHLVDESRFGAHDEDGRGESYN